MSQPFKVNFKVYQGGTFNESLRWESSRKIYVPITGISKTAPIVVTLAEPLGAPNGWRVNITGVEGMKEINSPDTYHVVDSISGNTFEINNINATRYTAYSAGGIVEYNEPVDLAGYIGRMQIRASLDSPEVLLELTTENGGIVIDNTQKTITINITYAQTAVFDFSTAVYSLELERAGVVTPFVNGNLTLIREVTR